MRRVTSDPDPEGLTQTEPRPRTGLRVDCIAAVVLQLRGTRRLRHRTPARTATLNLNTQFGRGSIRVFI